MTQSDAMSEREHSEAWRRVLGGEFGQVKYLRRALGSIPSGPRCKLCLAPLKAPGSIVLRPLGFGPPRLNRRLCRACFWSLDKKLGGAEIELSLSATPTSTNRASGCRSMTCGAASSRSWKPFGAESRPANRTARSPGASHGGACADGERYSSTSHVFGDHSTGRRQASPICL